MNGEGIRRRLAGLLVAGVLGSIAILTWYGYRAVRGWRESAALLAERRAAETANLLLTAVTRDMRGVQSVVLSSPHADEFMLDPPYDVRAIAASAFARYPYPELFFAWRGDPSPEEVVFFDRAERRPVWDRDPTSSSRFPVVVAHYPRLAGDLIDHVRADAREGHRFSTFEMVQGGVPYHVVVRLLYRDALRERLESVFGFTVNIDWVRRTYFGELTRQVARINDAGQGLLLQVVDDHGRRVVTVPGGAARGPTIGRPFPLRFFDPLSVESDAPAGVPWRVEVSVGDDPTLAAAEKGGSRTLLMADVAAGALALGVLLAFRATRASARLAELRSDFVSTVTHELKTPIASIRAMGDTLARDRVTDPAARAEYAQTIVQESKRLARLIDNLLAYSRITDVTEAYSYEPVDVHALVEEVLQGFSPQLSQRQFEVQVEIAQGLPRVRGDRTALRLMLENIVDNAIRYSGESRWVGLTARADSGRCAIEVTDRGIGIPRQDVHRVTQRFHRGRNAGSGGSGLGLAIVSRIVADLGGTLNIDSSLGRGTSVRVVLAVAGEEREEANPGR